MKRPDRRVIKQSAQECMEALIVAHEKLLALSTSSNLTARREYWESVGNRPDHISEFLREVESIIADGTEVIE